MNSFSLVGKINEMPQLQESKAGWKTCRLNLRVPRPFPNSNGIYEDDLVDVDVWRGAAETLCAVARINSWVSIKGRVASHPDQRNKYTFVAERVEYIQA